MSFAEQRQWLRALLAGSKCISPASVYDALSARVAQSVGFRLGLLAGSTVSSTTLAAPDLLVHTLTEYADVVRRITRASCISLYVDADHGYGNALNVMRTVQELEHAGVSALSIEDTAGPVAFGHIEGRQRLVPLEEAAAKLRAAVAARSDPLLVIVGRTPALKLEGVESAIARAKAYAAAGADVIHLAGGVENLDHVCAIHAAAGKPIASGSGKGLLKHDELAACGVRILLQGHPPVAAAVKALRDVYTHLYNGGSPADLKGKIASEKEMDQLVSGERYRQSLRDFMS